MCKDVTCSNDGTCSANETRDDYVCTCIAGWGGKDCKLCNGTPPTPDPPGDICSGIALADCKGDDDLQHACPTTCGMCFASTTSVATTTITTTTTTTSTTATETIATCDGGGLALTPALYKQGYDAYKDAVCVPAGKFCGGKDKKSCPKSVVLENMDQLVYVGAHAFASFRTLTMQGSFKKLKLIEDGAFSFAGSSITLDGADVPALETVEDRAFSEFHGDIVITGAFPKWTKVGDTAFYDPNSNGNYRIEIQCRGDSWSVGSSAYFNVGHHDSAGEKIKCSDLCNSKHDPAKCQTTYKGKCDDSILGNDAKKECPVMCNSCVTSTTTTTTTSTVTCNGQGDPPSCNKDYSTKCSDGEIGKTVRNSCPVMCGTCIATSVTPTSASPTTTTIPVTTVTTLSTTTNARSSTTATTHTTTTLASITTTTTTTLTTTATTTCKGGGLALTPDLYMQGYAAYKAAVCIPDCAFGQTQDTTYNNCPDNPVLSLNVTLENMAQLAYVGQHAFHSFPGEITIKGSFPKLKEIRDHAFDGSGTFSSSVLLDSANFLALESPGPWAFRSFKGNLTIKGPFKNWKNISTYAFYAAGNSDSSIVLGSAAGDAAVLEKVGENAFQHFLGKITIKGSFPYLKEIGGGAFESSGTTNSLIALDGAIALETIGSYAFGEYAGQVTFAGPFPKLKEIGHYAFKGLADSGNTASSITLYGATPSVLESVGEYSFLFFKGKVNITGEFPNLKEIGDSAFDHANNAKNVIEIQCRNESWSVGSRPFNGYNGTHNPVAEMCACFTGCKTTTTTDTTATTPTDTTTTLATTRTTLTSITTSTSMATATTPTAASDTTISTTTPSTTTAAIDSSSTSTSASSLSSSSSSPPSSSSSSSSWSIRTGKTTSSSTRATATTLTPDPLSKGAGDPSIAIYGGIGGGLLCLLLCIAAIFKARKHNIKRLLSRYNNDNDGNDDDMQLLDLESSAPSTPATPKKTLSPHRREKFIAPVIRLGRATQAAHGLADLMGYDSISIVQHIMTNGGGIAAIKNEVMMHGNAEDKKNVQGLIDGTYANPDNDDETSAEELAAQKKTIDELMKTDQVRTAKLKRAHVLALRLYTTSTYSSVNQPLRTNLPTKPHPFAVTTFYISEGIKLLRAVAGELPGAHEPQVLWRGLKDLTISKEFLESGGTEFACMSTSLKEATAIDFAKDSRAPMIIKLETKDFMSRGADISFLSVYPGESEVLFPPLTFLRPIAKETKTVVKKGKKYLMVRCEPVIP